MRAIIESYFRSRTSLREAELTRICSCAIEKKLHRNEFLFREGEVSRHKVFVVSGLLYTFGTSSEGNEHILQFSPEGTWTLDAESYDTQTPSRYNMAAVEESDVFLWTKADFDQLLTEIPALKILSQQLISRAVHNSRQRLASALAATPEEKYNDFIQSHPDLMARLPLRMIAAYLGISIKTLTRLRHAQYTDKNKSMVK